MFVVQPLSGVGQNDSGGPAATERVAGSSERQRSRAMRVRSLTEESFANESRIRRPVTSGTRMAQPLVPSGPGRPCWTAGPPRSCDSRPVNVRVRHFELTAMIRSRRDFMPIAGRNLRVALLFVGLLAPAANMV